MPQETHSRPRHAVVLSGAGGFGAFEVGVLRALAEGKCHATLGPLDADIYTGTSVGAFNAAVMVARNLDALTAAARLEDLWLHRIAGELADNGVFRLRPNPAVMLDPAAILRQGGWPIIEAATDTAQLAAGAAQRLGRLFLSAQPLDHRLADLINLESLISTEPLEQLVRETLPLADVLTSHRVLKIATTDWRAGELRMFSHDPVGGARHRSERRGQITEGTWPQAVLASAAIPAVFPKVLIGGDPHVDGGLVMNTPLKPAVRAGADIVHLVYVSPEVDAHRGEWNDPWSNTIETTGRAMTMAFAASVEGDVDVAGTVNSLLERGSSRSRYAPLTVHLYNPSRSLGGSLGLLDFSRSSIEQRIRTGHEVASHHDCVKERCLIPGSPRSPKRNE